MKLCSINCETKNHNLPLATYILGKIIFHALIYTISFYWVASCEVSIKSTEDGWESHLKSENTNHRFVCLLGRKMFHESQFLQLQLNYFSETLEKKTPILLVLLYLLIGLAAHGTPKALWEGGTQPWSWAPPNLHLLLPNTWANQVTKGSLSSGAGVLNNHGHTGNPQHLAVVPTVSESSQTALHQLRSEQRERKHREEICSKNVF